MVSNMSRTIMTYERLNEKYLRDGEDLFSKGDYSQASEKFWGAAAEIPKAFATKRGRKTRTHDDLWKFVIELDKQNPELDLIRDFYDANHLHSNFYEDELLPEAIQVGANAVRDYVNKIKQLIKGYVVEGGGSSSFQRG